MSQFISMTSTNADIVILGGDLNTEPGDLSYRMIRHNAQLQDSFLQAQQVCLTSISKMDIALLTICIFRCVHKIVKSNY
jgi:endonuclease/exonuclease/phosphatase family metal-dependent hydrolase